MKTCNRILGLNWSTMTISFNRFNRRGFLRGTASVAAALSTRLGWSLPVSTDSIDYILHFAQPPAPWPDPLPVGNGRLGAMVFGSLSLDRIQLNEESIWDGDLRDRNNPKAGE